MSKNFELLLQAGATGDYFDEIELRSLETQTPPGARRYRFSRSEEFDQLVRRLFFNSNSAGVRSLVISGIPETPPATEACAQIGKTLASLVDTRVCIVDANIAFPSLHRLFGDDNLAGFADALMRSKPVRSLARQVDNSNLYLLPGGAATARQRNADMDVAARLAELQQEFDYLVVAAPLADSPSGLTAIGRACDGALLVVESSGVPLDVILRIRRQLEAASVPLLGVVLSGRPTARRYSTSID